jgi:hypothetical protein
MSGRDHPRPPDLQKLVAQHGAYSDIPAAAWAAYDTAIAQWRVDRLHAMGVRPISTEEAKERRRRRRREEGAP